MSTKPLVKLISDANFWLAGTSLGVAQRTPLLGITPHQRFWFSLLLQEQPVPSVPGDWQPSLRGTKCILGTGPGNDPEVSAPRTNKRGILLFRNRHSELCIPSGHRDCWSAVGKGNCREFWVPWFTCSPRNPPLSLQRPPKAPTNKRDLLQRLCCADTLVSCKVREKQQLKKQLQTHSHFYTWALAAWK